MSKMKELYLKVAADESLQEKVNKILEAAGKNVDAAGKNLVEFAKEQGYDVTVEEIGEFFKTISEASDGKLSDEELDAVAGGKGGGGGIVNSSLINPQACGGREDNPLMSIISLKAVICA